MFWWNSFCYGNTSQLIYPAAVFVSQIQLEKKSWFMGFSIPSFLPAFFPFFSSLFPSLQNTHDFHHFFKDRYKDAEVSSLLPQTKNGFNKKIHALWQGHFGDFFFPWSWSKTSFLCTYITHMYVTFRQTVFSGKNHSCILANCGSGWVSGLSLWAIKKSVLPEGNLSEGGLNHPMDIPVFPHDCKAYAGPLNEAIYQPS